MLNPIVNAIAISNCIFGMSIGAVLLMPSLMSFDAAPNVNPSMMLLGCSGLSVIPFAVVATTMSLLTDDLGYQSMYAIPAFGLGLGIISNGLFTQK
jgi:hypothetical protein